MELPAGHTSTPNHVYKDILSGARHAPPPAPPPQRPPQAASASVLPSDGHYHNSDDEEGDGDELVEPIVPPSQPQSHTDRVYWVFTCGLTSAPEPLTYDEMYEQYELYGERLCYTTPTPSPVPSQEDLHHPSHWDFAPSDNSQDDHDPRLFPTYCGLSIAHVASVTTITKVCSREASYV